MSYTELALAFVQQLLLILVAAQVFGYLAKFIGQPKVVGEMIAGVVLIALAATGVVGWWGWLGVVPLLTGSLNFCPLYPLLGISTCKVKSD